MSQSGWKNPTLDSDDLLGFLDRYRTPHGHFDEFLTDGAPRQPWQDLAGSTSLRRSVLDAAEARVAQQIHRNGVTYNVYEAEEGPSRPWALDVLPFIIPAPEWDRLAVGLLQRARLMNAIAADIYGPQHLLRDGIVPPAVIYKHPGFLRACHGVQPVGGSFVHLIAFDLARDPNGGWLVMGTRAQAPSGAGYALENRAAISRLFPDAFRAMHVHSLAPFFLTLQRALLATAPTDGESPYAVLLTPGPYNETYFEHAFLAKHLGFPLVQGDDLTVRQNKVYLKTVSGLRRVHAVLRRLDDDYCDALELRPDSTLGVPGLLQAWRSGNVLVANALGTGVLESPALHGFLPSICERLLGQSLELSTIRTLWCGMPDASNAVRQRLALGVVKPAFPGTSMEPVFLSALDDDERAEWDARLDKHGENFVVEEFVPLSHVPIWRDGHLASQALMLRVFLVADGMGDYRVMPGGLSRIAGTERQIVSGQRGGSSKDTWVFGDTGEEPPPPADRRPHSRENDPMVGATSSRAAENLFWLGRYAERSENCARLARAALTRLSQADDVSSRLEEVCLEACRRHGLLGPTPSEMAEIAPREALLNGLFDRGCQSLAFNIGQTIRVAGAVRDRLSSDNWKVLSRLSELFTQPAGRLDPDATLQAHIDDALELIDRAIVSLVAIGGLEMAHMTRDDGWRFLTLGRHLERLWFVAATLEDVAAERASDDPAVLEWLLDLSDSLITYRTRHVQQPVWWLVVDLLLLDPRNPRSAAFQISKLAKHVRLLPNGDLTEVGDDIERLREVCRQVDRAQGELFEEIARIENIIGGCRRLAPAVADALTLRYFSHVYERPHTTVTP